MPKVALATCSHLPNLDEDGPALIKALGTLGIEAVPVVWNQEHDWGAFDSVVIRSTWDYVPQLSSFLRWAREVEEQSTLANPFPVVRWNTDKHYLRELADAGHPVVETRWLEPGEPLEAAPHAQLVIKPAVSAGARDTARYASSDLPAAQAHVRALHAQKRTVMVQPYCETIETEGESALIFFAGRLSHAIRKGPLLKARTQPHSDLYAPERISARVPTKNEIRVAQDVLDSLPLRRSLLFARVDLVPPRDRPSILEVELTEPSLFLAHALGATERFATAISGLVDAKASKANRI